VLAFNWGQYSRQLIVSYRISFKWIKITEKESNPLIPDGVITSKIYFIRNQNVMLDKDLAELYGVKTKVLNQSVQRNKERFPEDFMFQLSSNEYEILKSQFVTSSGGGANLAPPIMRKWDHWY